MRIIKNNEKNNSNVLPSVSRSGNLSVVIMSPRGKSKKETKEEGKVPAPGGETSEPEPGTPASKGTLEQAAANAKKAYNEEREHPGLFTYSEGPGRGNGGKLFATASGHSSREFDCSSFVTVCYKEAGLPDPSGLNYHPIGTTKTLMPHCKKVHKPEAGMLCFYGGVYNAPTHVTIVMPDTANAVSMGKQGDPYLGPAEHLGPAPFWGYFKPNNAP